MVYKALFGSAPPYITELCIPIASIRPCQVVLHSG